MRGSLALAAAQPQWSAGLRAATAMLVPLAIGWAARRPEMQWASLGGWLAMLADPGGPYPARARAMAAFAAAGASTALAGSLTGHTPWIAIPALFVCSLLCSLLRIRGDAAGIIGVLSLTMFCIAQGTPAPPGVSLARAGLFVAGALFALLLSLAVWPFRPYRPVRQAVAACWSTIGELAVAVARQATSPYDAASWDALVPLRRRAREALEEARTALGVARTGRQGETARGLQLLVLYEISELLLGDLTALLEALRARLEQGQAPAPQVAEALRNVAAVQQVIATAVAEEAPAPHPDAIAPPAGSGETAILLARVAAETRQGVESARALEQGGEGPDRPGALAPPDEGPSLRDALAPGSIELQHALRVAIVATAGALAAAALHLQRSYWVTITVIIVLQPHSVATVRRALQRVAGTVIGGIVASLIVPAVRQSPVLGALLFVFASAGVAVRRINYAVFAALITPVFVVLAELNARGAHLVVERILDTVLGGALALAGALLLWPHRDVEHMPSLIAAVLRAGRSYLQAVLGGEGPASVVAARRHVGLATANAEAALQRMLSESPPAGRAEAWMALIAYARRLSASITGLGAAPPSAEPAGRLDEAFRILIEALESGAAPGSLPDIDDPSMPEPAQRLARQLRVVHSALARVA